MSSELKNSIPKKEDLIISNGQLSDQESTKSDDSFKSSKTSTSDHNVPIIESEKLPLSVETDLNNVNLKNNNSKVNDFLNENNAKENLKEQIVKEVDEISKDGKSKDVSKSSSKNNMKSDENSSKIEQTESTPSSSSIDLEQMISNLEISDDNNELTNSLINLIHKRTSLHESIESKNKSQMKKLSIVSLDFDGVVDYIKEKKCSKIIVMIGAGVSTSAGIPDFRSPNSGIFSKMKKYKLPSPECVFEINYFKKNPKPFFELGAEIFTNKKYRPTLTHNFIKLLDDKNLLLRLYTQNIDGLEAECGLKDEKVVYAHGSFNKSHCLNCNADYDFEYMKKFMSEERKEVVIPRCQKCNVKSKNIIKPDIVFYGQSLPESFFDSLEADFPQCDLLLIMGTSLVVQPFASLVNHVKPNVPRVLINRERAGEFLKQHDRHFSLKGSLVDKTNDRDVFLQGESDKIVMEIVEKLEWTEDLENLMNRFK